jgi:mRNA-degrading endonuclease RelE of RelBE toxin-antitoxin system
LRIDITSRFRRQIRSLKREDRRKIGAAIEVVRAAWGHPHLHAGIGLRKLGRDFYECRSGLQTRLVFELANDGVLLFHLLANHDEVRRFIKTLK